MQCGSAPLVSVAPRPVTSPGAPCALASEAAAPTGPLPSRPGLPDVDTPSPRCQDITFPLRGPSEPGSCHAEEPVQIPSVVIVTTASGRDMSSEPCHCRSQ